MNSCLVTLFFLHLLFLSFHIVQSRITCIGENGAPVTMFVLYKLPKIHHHPSEVVRNGSAYAYYDSEMLKAGKTKFQLSSRSIDDEDSAPGQTLKQVYKANMDGTQALQSHVFYNDESSDGKSFESSGHTKGGIAFDEEEGFWLIHSVPRAYPPPAAYGYRYPASGHTYGQMYMCVTFNSSSFDDIGLQLRYNNPHIHDFALPKQMEKRFMNVKMLVDGRMMTGKPHYRVIKLQAVNNDDIMDFHSFAKYTTFHNDLYSHIVAPTLEADLLTETWQHENRININSTCNTAYTVEDIAAINIDCGNSNDPISFSNYHDHSKFAIGKQKPYVCIGDINRQVSQYTRGGGTMCTKNELLHSVFQNLVETIHSCNKL